MKRLALMALASGMAIAAATPASAVVITAGSSGGIFDPFDASTRGTQLYINTQSGASTTIAGTLVSAVYRNTFGTLDFYFQVSRTGGTREIDGLNVDSYDSYMVEGFVDGTDFDGAGPFTTVNNPPSSTTRVGRSADGNIVRIDFGTNGLAGTENSTTYILRTNAFDFNLGGNATITNSTSFNIAGVGMPVAVPEPATWGMMIMGFGLLGGALRRRKTTVAFA